MDGLTNHRDRCRRTGARGEREPNVRVCKHVIFARGGARIRIMKGNALRSLGRLLAGKR